MPPYRGTYGAMCVKSVREKQLDGHFWNWSKNFISLRSFNGFLEKIE
jgi:hypothetical protein